MRRAILLSALLATGVAGCGIIDNLKEEISNIKGTVEGIKAVASGDIAAANAALDGAGIATEGALEEAGAVFEEATADAGGSGKRGFAVLADGELSDLDADRTITRDCPEGGTLSRDFTLQYRVATGRATVDVVTTAANCKFHLDDKGGNGDGPRIDSVQVVTSPAAVTVEGSGFGEPDAQSAVCFTPVASPSDGGCVNSEVTGIDEWTDTKITIDVDSFSEIDLPRVDSRIDVAVGDNFSNQVRANLSVSGTTEASDDEDDDNGSGGDLATLNGSQTVAVAIILETDGDGEPQPKTVESIELSSEAWSSKVEDGAGNVVSEQIYENFSLKAAQSGDDLGIDLQGRQVIQNADVSFDVAFGDDAGPLNVTMLAADLFGDDGSSKLAVAQDDSGDDSLSYSIDGAITLGLDVAGAQCIQGSYVFETVETLVSSASANCPVDGILTVTEDTEDEGPVSVTYEFNNGSVKFEGSDGELEVPCEALAAAGASCLAGE